MAGFFGDVLTQVVGGVATVGIVAAVSAHLARRRRLKSDGRAGSSRDTQAAHGGQIARPALDPARPVPSATLPQSSRRFPQSLPLERAIPHGVLIPRISAILAQLREGDGPRAIVIGRKGRPPRVQIFAGACSEEHVAQIRAILKEHDPDYEASVVKDPAQYAKYRTATLENPDGTIGRFAGA